MTKDVLEEHLIVTAIGLTGESERYCRWVTLNELSRDITQRRDQDPSFAAECDAWLRLFETWKAS